MNIILGARIDSCLCVYVGRCVCVCVCVCECVIAHMAMHTYENINIGEYSWI